MRGRLLVVSHASVLPVNQDVYARLGELGWDVRLVVPSRWRHEYATEPFAPVAAPGLGERLLPLPVLFPGLPQRHLYRVRVGAIVRRLAPQVAFLEAETFSIPARQWGRALHRAGVPFGVQADENLDRPLPALARALERGTLRDAAFVAARSPTAGERARRHGAAGAIDLVPHAVPRWEAAASTRDGVFTVGYAGRLVPEKGLRELAAATGRLGPETRLLLVGDGPLRAELALVPGVEVLTGVAHERMPEAFARMDVLALPSRTTERWAEQFGRVLVEALWCGVPVVGSDSGEIPWVINSTGGGVVVPEGDEPALAAALQGLRDDPSRRATLAATGRAAVERLFSVGTAAAALDRLLVDTLGDRRG